MLTGESSVDLVIKESVAGRAEFPMTCFYAHHPHRMAILID